MYAYNPRKKSPERLESSLVGADRWDILNGILKELALKKGEPPKQHWMIVGARGMGKSHLLTLLHHKVSSNKKLSKIWIPVLFPEEIRMAGDLARFLERAVTEVQCDLEKGGDTVAPDLKEKVAKVRSVRHDERVEYLFSILSWIRQATGRHILLIAENLQQLLGRKLSLIEQKKLRAFLQSDESLLLIGSATTVFNALHDHSHPFYHFFHIRRLEDLSFEDVKALVEDLLSNYKKEERSRIVMENEPRLRVLYSFTGGNPRMAVFLSDILKTNVNEEMIEIMDRILDELTPYFEAIINDTPEYLQEIINCLAAYEPAQTPKEIAEHLEMEQGTVRNYLKQAKESGYVRIAFSRGKSNFYCISEYLYRTWFQMRDSGHREQMRWMIELMLMLYSKDFILNENERLSLSSEEGNAQYKILIQQTLNFIENSPKYCALIDKCLTSSDLDKVVSSEQINSLIEKRIELFTNKMQTGVRSLLKNKLLGRLGFFDALYDLLVANLGDAFDNAEGKAVADSFAIAIHLRNTWDIEFALAKYQSKIVPLVESQTDTTWPVQMFTVEEKALRGMRLFWDILYCNYSAVKFTLEVDDIEEQYLTLSLYLSIVQLFYFVKHERFQDLKLVYDIILSVSNKITTCEVKENEAALYYLLFIASEINMLKTDVIDGIFKLAASKSEKAMAYSLLWRCLGHPDSEYASKAMIEPPVANLVNIVKKTIMEMKEQVKRRRG